MCAGDFSGVVGCGQSNKGMEWVGGWVMLIECGGWYKRPLHFWRENAIGRNPCGMCGTASTQNVVWKATLDGAEKMEKILQHLY